MRYVILFLVLFVVALIFTLSGCDNDTNRWRQDMPVEGTMLCSMAGEGFRIANNPFGFRVDRYQAFDNECKKRVK